MRVRRTGIKFHSRSTVVETRRTQRVSLSDLHSGLRKPINPGLSRARLHRGVSEQASPWRVDVAANSGADPVGYAEEVYLLCMALVLM